jgi:hypothetical protein
LPWGVTKEGAIQRVAEEMQQRKDPIDFIGICWFSTS